MTEETYAKWTLSLVRQRMGNTRAEMAKQMGLSSDQQIYKREKCPNPTLRTLRRYAAALGGTVEIRMKINGEVFDLIFPDDPNPKAP